MYIFISLFLHLPINFLFNNNIQITLQCRCLYIIILLLVSCVDDTTELEFLDGGPQVVIEGIITDVPSASFVRVMHTTSSEDTFRCQPLSSARILISEEGQPADTFHHTADGYYRSFAFCGEVHKQYTLNVTLNGQRYSATSYMPPHVTLDSMSYEPSSSDKDQTAYQVRIWGRRPSMNFDSYYRIRLLVNDTLMASASGLIVLADEHIKDFRGISLSNTFAPKDKVTVQVFSLTHELFYYFTDLMLSSNASIETMYNYPVNPQSNLSNGALGYFQVSSMATDSIFLP